MLISETGQRERSPEEGGDETCCTRHLECDCGAANAERYQNCWRCLRHKPRRRPIALIRAARDGRALEGLRVPCQYSLKSVVPVIADVERQAASNDLDRTSRRYEWSSLSQYSHYIHKVTPDSSRA
jgi:hypothetical protein